MISHTPIYNLMVVLKETGLNADVLRAWERRYHMPHPQRSAGRQRLYSDYDIATIKWLHSRQAEGLSISRAVQLWKDFLAAGRDPLAELTATNPSPDNFSANGISIENLRQLWLEGCLEFDVVKAEEALNQAFALYPVEKACSTILQQGLHDIGEEWYLGSVSVQQEHFASSLAIRRLEALIGSAPQPTRRQTVLVYCPLGELHTFPAILLSLFLQRKGLNVVYLGADNPLEQLDITVEAVHPDLAVLSAQQLASAASLAEAALAFQANKVPVAFGGLIFNRVPELRQRIAGTFLGESIEAATLNAELLVQSPAYHSPVPIEEKYRVLAHNFRQARHLIEQELLAALLKDGIRLEMLDQVNTYFGASLAAALDLGDPAYIEADLDWIAGLLNNRHLPIELLRSYLGAYRRSLHAVLGESGNPLTRWIDQYIAGQ